MRNKSLTQLRDYLKLRACAARRGGYVETNLHSLTRSVSRAGLRKLQDLGWITRHGRKYHIRSPYKIIYDLQLPEAYLVKIKTQKLRSNHKDWAGYCLGFVERYILTYKTRQQKYCTKLAKKGKKLYVSPNNSDEAQLVSQKPTISATSEFKSAGAIATRYIEKMTGMSQSTVSRLRREYNGKYNHYTYQHDIEIDSMKIDSKGKLVQFLEAKGLTGRSDLYIYFCKDLGHYRRIIGTIVSAKVKESNPSFYLKKRKKRYRYNKNSFSLVNYSIV